jgi:hypothetical protein
VANDGWIAMHSFLQPVALGASIDDLIERPLANEEWERTSLDEDKRVQKRGSVGSSNRGRHLFK